MIAKMQKVFLVSLEKSRRETLEALKSLGLMHLEEYRGQSERVDELQKARAQIERSIYILPSESAESSAEEPSLSDRTVDDALEIAKRLEQQNDELKERLDAVEKIDREEERIAPLGEFDPSQIEYLSGKGVQLTLYSLSKEERENFPSDITRFEVYRSKTRSVFAVVEQRQADRDELAETTGETSKTISGSLDNYEIFRIPEKSLTKLREDRETHTQEIEKIRNEINSLGAYRHTLKKALELLDEQIEFEEVRAGLAEEEDGRLVYLSGYVPEKRVEDLKNRASQNGWALIIKDPEPDENPPTLIENPPAVKIIKPVFDFLGTVPGYREYDISFLFLLFLTVFFAMIIGDAGYGILFLGTTVYSAVSRKKRHGTVPDIHRLLILMGGATIVWGLITGTWFGSKTLAEAPFLSWFVIEPIASFGSEMSGEVIRHMCFVIGTVQISIAHGMNFVKEIRQRPKVRALAQLGWLSMVLGLYYVVLFLVLGGDKYPIPQSSIYMVLAGLVAVFIFSEQEGHFIKGVLRGVANFLPKFLDSISAFSDIISYIRLFAVGLATVEIAKSFNSMAVDMGNGVIGIIGGIIILLIGHSLNMAMAALSVVVHGVRLNVLEFSGHLGMEWTGVPYNPFRYRNEKE
ncbi:MAG: V-type ATP synthase subunit I [Spirochaetaceae bacterium]